mmetsp:Transcript_35079/g.48825  ORF Transcript_35079/g.48825 Transcript_35079/m.48825 type:complete len:115 (-) Transcript_35079:276-620(-)
MALKKKDSNMSINSDLNEEHKFGGEESSAKQHETKSQVTIPETTSSMMIVSGLSRRESTVEMKEAKSKDNNTEDVIEIIGKRWRNNRSTSLMGILHGLTVVYVWQYLVYREMEK